MRTCFFCLRSRSAPNAATDNAINATAHGSGMAVLTVLATIP